MVSFENLLQRLGDKKKAKHKTFQLEKFILRKLSIFFLMYAHSTFLFYLANRMCLEQ